MVVSEYPCIILFLKSFIYSFGIKKLMLHEPLADSDFSCSNHAQKP